MRSGDKFGLGVNEVCVTAGESVCVVHGDRHSCGSPFMQSYSLRVAVSDSLVAYLRCLVSLHRLASVAHSMA